VREDTTEVEEPERDPSVEVRGRTASRDTHVVGSVAPHLPEIAPVGSRTDDAPAVSSGTEATTDRGDDDAAVGLVTAWAGLAFLLATAAEARLPDRTLDDPRLADRPLEWTMHHLGRRVVPVGTDDPVLLVLSGTAADDATTVLTAGDPAADEEAALDAIAAAWTEVTVRRLVEAGDDDGDPVRRMARRPGRVLAEPGWFEVHLDASTADLVTRRAGLDIDPGWVPWLGAVVRYVYV
jgi:hypothetical protein